MFRVYSFVFPTHLIPKGSDILIYGASDMGRDYAKYVMETKYCRIVAYTDRNYENIAPFYQYNFVPPESISTLKFEYVLIASTFCHDEICQLLVSSGIDIDKIKYAEIHKPIAPTPTVVNLYLEYFLARKQNRMMDEAFTSHPIHKFLIGALDKYSSAPLLDSAYATKALMEDFTACDSLAFSYPYENERYFYGNAQNLMSYSGYHNNDITLLPEVHHSVFNKRVDQWRPSHSLIIISNGYQQPYYDFPIIEIGSHIMYASPYLDREQMTELKNRLGYTLTVYPVDSAYGLENEFNEQRLLDYLYEESQNFDSVIVCLNFNAISEQKIKQYEKIGAKVLSSGVRSDQEFLCKSRSILDLTDVALCNYIGGPLNYVTALNKTVKWIDSNVLPSERIAPSSYIPEYENNKRLLQCELKSGENLSTKAVQCCHELYRHEWLKTPDEIRAIFEMNEAIYKRAYGDINSFHNCTAAYLDELSKSRDVEDALKYRLLYDAWDKMVKQHPSCT